MFSEESPEIRISLKEYRIFEKYTNRYSAIDYQNVSYHILIYFIRSCQ